MRQRALRLIAAAAGAALMAGALCGCAGGAGAAWESDGAGAKSAGAGAKSAGAEDQDGRLKVAATIFPYYDFIRQIGGDRIRLQLVVPAGMDSHSFEPTPADMIALEEADVLICNGGAMEHWVDQVLDSIDTSGTEILTMMDYVDVVEEELVEGMEDAHEEDAHAGHQHVFDPEDGHAMEIEYDEHIWTSPVNAAAIVEIISQTLAQVGDRLRETEKALQTARAGVEQSQKARQEIVGRLETGEAFMKEVLAAVEKLPALREREALWQVLGPGDWHVFGGHGPQKEITLE